MPRPSRWRRAALLPALLALVGACFPHTRVIGRDAEPVARLSEVRARAAGPRQAELVLVLDVENPGPALTAFNVEVALTAAGRPFAVGRLALEQSLAQGATTRLTLPLSLAYLELPVEPGAPAGELTVVVRGTLRALIFPNVVAMSFDAETRLTGRDGTRAEATP